jgi:hypothetical protein
MGQEGLRLEKPVTVLTAAAMPTVRVLISAHRLSAMG